MSLSWRWLIIILSLMTLVLIGLNLTDNRQKSTTMSEKTQPVYQSGQTVTLAYDPQGALSYQITAKYVEYYADTEISWFHNPMMTIYDAHKQPSWSVQADKAKLTKDKQLFLYGHVQVSALAPGAPLQEIVTDSAKVNLLTQDISSDDKVIISGPGLYSTGRKMRGNLRDKTARLIEQVKTSYETQNKSSTP